MEAKLHQRKESPTESSLNSNKNLKNQKTLDETTITKFFSLGSDKHITSQPVANLMFFFVIKLVTEKQLNLGESFL